MWTRQPPETPPIGYRVLTPDDFQAQQSPPDLKAHADRLGAALCGQISINPSSGFEARRQVSEDGEISYLVHIRHLRFMAQILPDCSWWNPQTRTRAHAARTGA